MPRKLTFKDSIKPYSWWLRKHNLLIIRNILSRKPTMQLTKTSIHAVNVCTRNKPAILFPTVSERSSIFHELFWTLFLVNYVCTQQLRVLKNMSCQWKCIMYARLSNRGILSWYISPLSCYICSLALQFPLNHLATPSPPISLPSQRSVAWPIWQIGPTPPLGSIWVVWLRGSKQGNP